MSFLGKRSARIPRKSRLTQSGMRNSRTVAAERLEGRDYFTGVGQGLVAEYYADNAFNSLALARTDATVNFTWSGAPASNLPADNYSVRWTGQVLADYSQSYTFYAASAGGVRVYVNGQKIIDNWTKHSQTENSGTISLSAGQYYPIQIDYREDGVGSVKLSWKSSSVAKQVVPKSQLYREGSAVATGGWLEGNVGSTSGAVSGSLQSGIDVTTGTPTSPPPPPPPPPPPSSGGVNVNFQPSAAPAVSGYLVDAGNLYGARNGQTYGWTVSHTDTVVDRNINADQLLDTNVGVKAGAKWELAVPNGSYTVTVGVGDAKIATSNNVWVEGVSLISFKSQAANAFSSKSITVNVADGKLTLGVGSAATGQTHIDYVQVSGAGLAAAKTSSVAASQTVTPRAIGGSSDSAHLLYHVVRGNVELIARQDPMDSGEGGLVVRTGLAATNAFVGLVRTASGLSLEWRSAEGGSASASSAVPVSGSVYLRLVRDGNNVEGYYATSAGGPWTFVASHAASFGTFAYVGLAAAGTNATAHFANVAFTPFNPAGANLSSQSDRIQDLAFVDLVKTTRGFFNTAGRKNASTGLTDFATTDANGWPTEDFSFDAVDNSEWNVPVDAGTYRMSFNGPAGVDVTASAGVGLSLVSYNASTDTYVYDVDVPGNLVKLGFTFDNTGGQVRNLRLLQPGYSLANTPTFTSKYIQLLKTTGPNVLRLMDWTKTNDNPTATWSDRNTPVQATQAKSSGFGQLQPVKGVAWEYAIELANAVGKDVWVNVPAHASDDYVRNLANLLRTTLNPDLNIYVEYTNEAWNTAFEQSTYIRTQAVNEVFADKAAGRASVLNYDGLAVDTSKPGTSNPNATVWGERWYARRVTQISDMFKTAWTNAGEESPINGRVRVILGAQYASSSRTTNHINFLKAKVGTPSKYIYGLAIAPYANLNGRAQSTADEVIASLTTSINNMSFSTQYSQASSNGLHLMAYEIGLDTFGDTNISAKRAAMLDPRAKDLVTKLLNKFFQAGGEQANWFNIAARSYKSPYGTWSITEDLDQLSSPKIQGFQQIVNGLPASTTVRGVFA